jgi:hypothetical protein
MDRRRGDDLGDEGGDGHDQHERRLRRDGAIRAQAIDQEGLHVEAVGRNLLLTDRLRSRSARAWKGSRLNRAPRMPQNPLQQAGFQFIGWIGDVETVSATKAETTTISMNGDFGVTARFVPKRSTKLDFKRN